MDNNLENLQKSLRALKLVVVILALGWLGTLGWLLSGNVPLPDVIKTERIDIVEADGRPAMVLANSQRPIAATLDGKPVMEGQEEERRGMPSIIFFDGKGDEVGGVLMGSIETEDGFMAGRHISLDANNQDQTVVMAHYQDENGSSSGIRISDRPAQHMFESYEALGLEPGATREELSAAIMSIPEAERQARLRELFGAQRAWFGSTRSGDASLVLKDADGRNRVVIEAPAEGAPSITLLDASGAPLLVLPASDNSNGN